MGRPQVTPNLPNMQARTPDRASNAGHAYDDGTRRTEILQTAASLIAISGLRTSLQEIADAAGILPGSLYHHFESKEAILVELLRVTTRILTASPSRPRAGWTTPIRDPLSTGSSTWPRRSRNAR